MPVKQFVTWTAVIVIAYYLVTTPTGAGQAIGHLLNGLKDAGDSLAGFFGSL